MGIRGVELAQQRLTVEEALRFRNVREDEVGLHAIAEVRAAKTERQDEARVDHEQHAEEHAVPMAEIADESREPSV